jgi:hypothetical protein
MELRLDEAEATELRELLTETLKELSSEIADTDNAEYQRTLRSRREPREDPPEARIPTRRVPGPGDRSAVSRAHSGARCRWCLRRHWYRVTSSPGAGCHGDRRSPRP